MYLGIDSGSTTTKLVLTDATGRVVEGDPERTTEATELWTFVRERGGAWLLAAIQQA